MKYNAIEQPKSGKQKKEGRRSILRSASSFVEKLSIKAIRWALSFLIRKWLWKLLMVYLPNLVSSVVSHVKSVFAWLADFIL